MPVKYARSGHGAKETRWAWESSAWRDGEAARVLLRLRRITLLDVPPAEATLDTEISPCHRVIEGRGHADDLIVLDTQLERASDAAIRTDRVHLSLAALVPLVGVAKCSL